MKKTIVFIFLCVILSSTCFVKMSKENPIFNLKGATAACFVADEEFDACSYMYCGDLVFNYCSLEAAQKKLDMLSQSQAIQIYLENADVKDVLKSLKCVDYTKSEVENLTVYTGWTPYFRGSVLVENRKVNLQIAVKDSKIVAGFPAILSGF